MCVIKFVKGPRYRYPPDGLLAPELQAYDVDVLEHEKAADFFSSDDFQDILLELTIPDQINNMSTADDDSSSGLNGRLRPRKSNALSSSNARVRNPEVKSTSKQRPKRTTTPSKVTPAKNNDLATKSDDTPTFQLLCPYCDRKLTSKQNLSKHIRRTHVPSVKQNTTIACLFCKHNETDLNQIIRHMVDNHPDQYIACLDCNSRFFSTLELAEHRIYICDKQKPTYSASLKKPIQNKKFNSIPDKVDYRTDVKEFHDGHGFNGIVISCELKPAQVHDEADIEDNITTNLILPPNKTLSNAVMEKNAVIVLDDIQWTKQLPPNFSFHNTDADQILSRLGVVHKSPRGGESTKKDWLKIFDEANQKFERCFDTTFYAQVASNVQENLNKFLDGSFNFNPDPDAMIKTRKSKFSVAINTAEGFPILLATEQFTRNVCERYIPRSIAPKHKWKWDSIENDRNALNPDQIKRDSHTNNCIITLVSGLDIWTQLCMRRKFNENFTNTPMKKKTEKRNAIGLELKEILESRDLPSTSCKILEKTTPKNCTRELPPTWLGLCHTKIRETPPPAVLSGEWVRPRCYVCCACGAQTRDARAVSAHINTHHPNAQVQHYEIVGDRLLKSDILKHLYVPPGQMVNRTRPPRGFRDCTKCNKAVSLEELHQHMLECAGDTPIIRRKVRPRPFGTRRRRPRIPNNTIRKKIRKQIRSRHSRPKNRLRRTLPKIRSEVGDAETIRKMIANLPAKRHRGTLNSDNSIIRPQRNIDKQQRKKLIMKRRGTEELRNRRLRVVRNSALSFNEGQVTTEDSNQQNEEEESTLPKPRLPRMSTRRMEALKASKQKLFAGRPLRIPIRMHGTNMSSDQASDGKNNLGLDKPTDGIEGGDQSRDNNSQRSNIGGDSSSSRQQGRRGTPMQGGRQPGRRGTPTRGGRSGDGRNGGGNAPIRNGNNDPTPQQTPPLKHSIARLCGNLETHDKSVQFQPMFLIQQECNNAPHHVPTGQQLLFENEAVVTKLDKPPIYDYKGGTDERAVDVCSLKSKQNNNKPRKGLNDCIAMLINKLVEPASVNQEYVSVQCGDDEPLENISTVPVLQSPKSSFFESPTPCPPINSIDQVRCIDTMDKTPNDDLSKFGYSMPMPVLPVTYPPPFVEPPSPQDPVFKTPSKRGAKAYTAPPKKRTTLVLPRRESVRRKAAIRAESEIQKQKLSELAAQMQAFTPKYSDDCAAKQIVPPKNYKSVRNNKPAIIDLPPKTVQVQVRTQDKMKALEAFVRPMEPLTVKTSDKVRVLDNNHQSFPTYNLRYNTSNRGLPKKMRAASIPKNLNPCNYLPDRSAIRRYSLDITSQYNVNTQLSPQFQVHNLINHSPKDLSVIQHSPRESNYRILHSPLEGKVDNSPIDDTFWLQQPNWREYETSPSIQLSPKDSESGYQLSSKYAISRTHSPSELYSSLNFEKEVIPGIPSRHIHYSTREPSSGYKDIQQSYGERQELVPPIPLSRSTYALSQLVIPLPASTNENSVEYSGISTPLDLSGKSEVVDMSKQGKTKNQVNPVADYEDYEASNLSDRQTSMAIQEQEIEEVEEELIVDLRVKTQNTRSTSSYYPSCNSENHYLPTEVRLTYERNLAASNAAYPKHRFANSNYCEVPSEVNSAVLKYLPQKPLNVTYIDDSINLSQRSYVDSGTSANLVDESKGLPEVKIADNGIESGICKAEELSPYNPAVMAPQHQTNRKPLPVVDTVEQINLMEKPEVQALPITTMASQPMSSIHVPSTVKLSCEIKDNLLFDATHLSKIPSLSKTENDVSNNTLESAGVSISMIETSSMVTQNLSSTQTTTITNILPENLKIGNDDKATIKFEKNSSPIDIDHDPEVAKKIELLPRELIEIIGNMPPDHRNKLLNVLPQYVTASMSNQEKAKEQTVTCAKLSNTVVDQPFPTNDAPKITSDPYCKYSNPRETLQDGHSSNETKDERLNEEPATTMLGYESTQNNVIDLTNDDPLVIPTDTVGRESNSTNGVPVFKSTVNAVSIAHLSKPKSNNEQTASLRAVRIKTALERQKTTNVKPLLIEPSLPETVNVEDTLEKRTPEIISVGAAAPQVEVTNTHSHIENTPTKTFCGVLPTTQSINEHNSPANKHNHESQINTLDVTASLTEKLENTTENIILDKTSSDQDLKTKPIIENSSFVEDDTTILTKETKEDEIKKIEIDPNKLTEESFLNRTPIENCLPLDNSTPKQGEKLAQEEHLQPPQITTPAVMIDVSGNKYDDSDDDISLALIVQQRKKNEVINLESTINISDVKSKNLIKRKKNKRDMSHGLVENYKSNKKNSNTKNIKKTVCTKKSKSALIHDGESTKKGRKNKKHLKKNTNTKLLGNISALCDNTNILNPCKSDVVSCELTKDISDDTLQSDNSTKNKVVTQAESISQVTTESVCLVTDPIAREIESGTDENIHSITEEPNDSKMIIVDGTQNISNDSGTNITETSEGNVCTNFGYVTFDESLVQVIKDDKNDCTIPLRRSKRGKSLYIESSKVLSKVSDVKTPLTKKQVIFSKLLHDESCRNNDTFNIEPENDSVIDATDSCEDFNNTIGFDNSSHKPISNKSNKRKKSPQSEQKTKKIKSDCTADVLLVASDSNASDKQNSETIPTTESLKGDALVLEEKESDGKDVINDECLITLQKLDKKTEKEIDLVNELNTKLLTSAKKRIPTTESLKGDALVLEEKESDGKDVINDECLITLQKLDKKTEKEIVLVNELNTKLLTSAKKRKIEINVTENNSQESKKIKLNQAKLDDVSQNENRIGPVRSTCYSQAVSAGRRTRSKFLVYRSSNSDTYDPYDIDLDEMNENSEPCKKNNKHSKNSNLKHSKVAPKNKELKVKKIETNKVQTFTNKEDQNKTDAMEADSDSSQSDIPLNKYVKDKEVQSNKRQKHKADLKDNCKLQDISNNKDGNPSTQTDTAELRSEQFMESFGFFSERKPRKSNLLATKKISETFNIIEIEEYDTKKADEKKKTHNEIKKPKVVEKTATSKAKPKKPKKVKEKREPKEDTKLACYCYCIYCKKIFGRLDNYLRHQMSKYHISKLAQAELNFDTNLTFDGSNHLVAYKQELDIQIKYQKKLDIHLQQKQKTDKNNKTSNKPKPQSLSDIYNKVQEKIKEEELKMNTQNRDDILFLNCCRLLKAFRQKSAVKVYLDNSTVSMCPFEPANDSQSSTSHSNGSLANVTNFKENNSNTNANNLNPNANNLNASPPNINDSNASHPNASILNTSNTNENPSNASISDASNLNTSDSNEILPNVSISNESLPNPSLSNASLSNESLSNDNVLNASEINDVKNDESTNTNPDKNIVENDLKADLEEPEKNELIQQQEQKFEKSTLFGTLMDTSKIRALCGINYVLNNLPKLIPPKRPLGPIAYTDKIMIPRRKIPGGPPRRSSKYKKKTKENVENKSVKFEPKPSTSRQANAQQNKICPPENTKTCTVKLTKSKKKKKKRSICEPRPGTSKKLSKNYPRPNLTENTKKEEPIKYPEYKEKMYPDIVIEDIDMLEDKFDKIKRKCRSQAAAAKQTPAVVERISAKIRKKCDKKKIKKKTKKNGHSSTVLTKGALKGFDGIKVSIQTTDINISAIPKETINNETRDTKKKKKNNSKKKRDLRNSVSSNKNDCERGNTTSQKKVDVYEFMDNDDAELFDFRPSTLMERFKSMSSKDNGNTSESGVATKDVNLSSESGSDEDDFVYMSDDYVCSDDETENSLLSCELGNNKPNVETKKIISPVKRKETVDKSAVMGKIFKNNAVRGDRKSAKSKEIAKSKTNLDQLFDSLLNNEQKTVDEEVKASSEVLVSKEDEKELEDSLTKTYVEMSTQYEPLLIETETTSPKKDETNVTKFVSLLPMERLSTSTAMTSSRRNTSISPRIRAATPKIIENYSRTNSPIDDAFAKVSQDMDDIHAPSTSKKYSTPSKEYKHLSRKLDFLCSSFESSRNHGRTVYDDYPLRETKELKHQKHSSKKSSRFESSLKDETSTHDIMDDSRDDAGVARQRARRKCTVGKQNVLAESWSSESDADCAPRPASATSVAMAAVRKKKAKRRDVASIGRRKSQAPSRKLEESRVSTPLSIDWSADSEEHVQQHGWIVGDSHKKLVTMLAHAKGRKRTPDDDRNDLD